MGEERTWYVGLIQGYGRCAWLETENGVTHIAAYQERAISATQIGHRWVPAGPVADKMAEGAFMHINPDAIILRAKAKQEVIDEVLEALGCKQIVRASAADLSKAPKLSLVK